MPGVVPGRVTAGRRRGSLAGAQQGAGGRRLQDAEDDRPRPPQVAERPSTGVGTAAASRFAVSTNPAAAADTDSRPAMVPRTGPTRLCSIDGVVTPSDSASTSSPGRAWRAPPGPGSADARPRAAFRERANTP